MVDHKLSLLTNDRWQILMLSPVVVINCGSQPEQQDRQPHHHHHHHHHNHHHEHKQYIHRPAVEIAITTLCSPATTAMLASQTAATT